MNVIAQRAMLVVALVAITACGSDADVAATRKMDGSIAADAGLPRPTAAQTSTGHADAGTPDAAAQGPERTAPSCSELELMTFTALVNGQPSHQSSGRPSGLVLCGPADGAIPFGVDTVHRVRAVDCTEPVVGFPTDVDPLRCDDAPRHCTNVGDPIELDGGTFFGPECVTDADCGAGQACICAAGTSDASGLAWTYCVPAACRTDDDCEDGWCKLTADDCGIWEGLHCESAEDRCHVAEDCVGQVSGPYNCYFSTAVDAWTCGEAYGGCE